MQKNFKELSENTDILHCKFLGLNNENNPNYVVRKYGENKLSYKSGVKIYVFGLDIFMTRADRFFLCIRVGTFNAINNP